jgi:ABC-type Fe3+ transport system substrate-binding protein
MPKHKLLLIFIFLGLSIATRVRSQDSATINGAKQEGEVSYYTGKNLSTMRNVASVFEKRYPFLTVKITRTSGEQIINKIQTEKLAGKMLFDVVSASPVPLLEPLNLIKPYCSPEMKSFPESFRHPKCLWSAIVGNYYVLMYNTKMLSKEDVPRDWDELLNPKWRGEKISIDPEEYSWLAGMETYLGEEKTRRLMTSLAKQQIRWQKSQQNIAQLLVAGEFPLGLGYATRTTVIQETGAPINWIRTTKPIVVDLHNVAMSAQPPHPNAARLWIDFLHSQEGQKALYENKESVLRPGVMPLSSPLSAADLELSPVPYQIFSPTTFKRYQAKFDEYFGPRR